MKIKYIPVSLRTLNEGSRGKQQQYYVLKRSDNFDFSSVGDKLYNEIKSLGKRGNNKDFIKTYLNNGIKTFPLAKRFNTTVIELPQIPKSKVSDIIYDAKNDRFLYLIQRYDGGGIEKGNKQNIYLSADSINFPVEARNVKKKYNINYFSNDTVIESESINNNIKNTYCNKPIELLSCIYDNDIDQYIILIKDLTNDNEINLYLNKEDFDIISKYGCVSDEEGHELCLDVSKLNLNESNKVLNESFKDPFLKELIDNSYNDIKFNSFTDKSLKNKIERSNLLPMVDWANLTEMDYTIVKSNISLLDDKTFNESAYKIFCSYDDNNNPYIVGINIKDIIWYTKYPIYYITYTKIERQEHDVKQNEVKLLNNSDFVILFNNDVLRNKKWNDRLMAKQNMNINPNSVKYHNLIRYRENILKNRLKNDNLHNNLTNTEKTFDIDKYIDSEFPIDYSKFGIPKWLKNKKINESLNDSFIKELIDNSFKSSYKSYSIPIKRKLRSLPVSFDWANISNNDYIEVSPNEAKNNYPTDFKFYCKYDNEHKPYIIGIVNPDKYTLYDIYSIKNSKGSVVKNHSELYISRDADFALVFDSKLSDDYRNKRKTRIESRENALALMDPEKIKSNNINRYLSIIANKKYNNDILDDYIKNTLSIGNKKIEDLFDEYLKLNKSDDPDKKFIFHLFNKIKELNGYISSLLSTYEKYIDTKNLIKSMKGSSYDVEQIKQYKDNIIRYIDNIKDI